MGTVSKVMLFITVIVVFGALLQLRRESGGGFGVLGFTAMFIVMGLLRKSLFGKKAETDEKKEEAGLSLRKDDDRRKGGDAQ